MIVADSNLIAYLMIPGEKSAISDAVLERDPEWATPLIWRSELRNILTLYMRHREMTLSQAQQTMSRAEKLCAPCEYALPSDLVLELTAMTNLSAYDAEFVVLAKQLGANLVTFDKKILKEMPGLAVEPEWFIK